MKQAKLNCTVLLHTYEDTLDVLGLNSVASNSVANEFVNTIIKCILICMCVHGFHSGYLGCMVPAWGSSHHWAGILFYIQDCNSLFNRVSLLNRSL